MRFSFEGFDLDTTTYELRRDGELIQVEPQVFDVLAHLIRYRHRLVSREELLDAVWGDRFVSESALTSRIRDARRALGDDGRQQRYIRTAHGRGYRFSADHVTADDDDTGTAPRGPASITGGGLHQVPAERTPLYGRREAIEEVGSLIGRHRLVSLLGIGGTGKTRLAAAVARTMGDRFTDGVRFVDLVPARGTVAIETTIAHGFGLALSAGSARNQLARMIASRSLLVVLDNCEHVRDEVATLLDHLLEHTTAPRFLVTSRVPLGLPDERRVAVPALPADGPSAPAVELFVSSAERFGATVSPAELGTVQRICSELDGLPLAIELAAAQLRLLSPEDVASRLDQRLQLLRTPSRPGRERHASLSTVLEGTLSLLEPVERELLGRLAAFPGPFDVKDVEQLCADLPPGSAPLLLAQLLDHSLVTTTGGGYGRFRLLETVRLLGRDLGDADLHADRHARWCLEQVGPDVGSHLFNYDTATFCQRHYDDLRAAERHLVATGRHQEAAILLAGTALMAHTDSGARATDLLTAIDTHLEHLSDPALTARLHLVGVMAGMATRSPEVIDAHGAQALEAARASEDPVVIAVALVLRSWSTVFGDRRLAVAMVREAAALADGVGHARARHLADGYRAFYLALLRRYDEAIELAETVAAGAGPESGYGYDVAATVLAACHALHQPTEALRWVNHLGRRLPPERSMWANQVLAACVHASCGEAATTLALVETVQARLASAERDGLPDVLVPAAVLAHRLGDHDRAARLVGAVSDAGRPTQSFQVTCLYRRLREEVAPATAPVPAPVPVAGTLHEIGEEAIAWMRDTARTA